MTKDKEIYLEDSKPNWQPFWDNDRKWWVAKYRNKEAKDELVGPDLEDLIIFATENVCPQNVELIKQHLLSRICSRLPGDFNLSESRLFHVRLFYNEILRQVETILKSHPFHEEMKRLRDFVFGVTGDDVQDKKPDEPDVPDEANVPSCKKAKITEDFSDLAGKTVPRDIVLKAVTYPTDENLKELKHSLYKHLPRTSGGHRLHRFHTKARDLIHQMLGGNATNSKLRELAVLLLGVVADIPVEDLWEMHDRRLVGELMTEKEESKTKNEEAMKVDIEPTPYFRIVSGAAGDGVRHTANIEKAIERVDLAEAAARERALNEERTMNEATEKHTKEVGEKRVIAEVMSLNAELLDHGYKPHGLSKADWIHVENTEMSNVEPLDNSDIFERFSILVPTEREAVGNVYKIVRDYNLTKTAAGPIHVPGDDFILFQFTKNPALVVNFNRWEADRFSWDIIRARLFDNYDYGLTFNEWYGIPSSSLELNRDFPDFPIREFIREFPAFVEYGLLGTILQVIKKHHFYSPLPNDFLVFQISKGTILCDATRCKSWETYRTQWMQICQRLRVSFNVHDIGLSEWKMISEVILEGEKDAKPISDEEGKTEVLTINEAVKSLNKKDDLKEELPRERWIMRVFNEMVAKYTVFRVYPAFPGESDEEAVLRARVTRELLCLLRTVAQNDLLFFPPDDFVMFQLTKDRKYIKKEDMVGIGGIIWNVDPAQLENWHRIQEEYHKIHNAELPFHTAGFIQSSKNKVVLGEELEKKQPGGDITDLMKRHKVLQTEHDQLVRQRDDMFVLIQRTCGTHTIISGLKKYDYKGEFPFAESLIAMKENTTIWLTVQSNMPDVDVVRDVYINPLHPASGMFTRRCHMKATSVNNVFVYQLGFDADQILRVFEQYVEKDTYGFNRFVIPFRKSSKCEDGEYIPRLKSTEDFRIRAATSCGGQIELDLEDLKWDSAGGLKWNISFKDSAKVDDLINMIKNKKCWE